MFQFIIEDLYEFVICFLWIFYLTLRLSEHIWITLCTDFLYFDITWLLSIVSFSIVSIWAAGDRSLHSLRFKRARSI